MLKKLLFAVALVVFATALNAQTIIWEENFDAGTTFPTGWAQETAASDGGWKIGKSSDLSSAYFTIPDRSGYVIATNDDGCGQTCNKSNDFLKTPVIDLSAQAVELYLAFDVVYYNEIYQGIQETLTVLGSDDGGTTWNELTPVTAHFNWAGQLVDVSAYAGKANVQFAFKYNDGGGWLYGAALDNIKVAVKDDIVRAKAGSLDYSHFISAIPGDIPGTNKVLAGGFLSLSSALVNTGFAKITSFDATLNYGGQSSTTSFSNLDVGYGASYFFNFDNTIAVPAGDNDISFTISNINGGDDDNLADNTFESVVTGIASLSPDRKIIGEEGTGTWCQWCPRGAVLMDYMAETYPDNFIPIAVHNGDPMVVAAAAGGYDAAISNIIPGYPGGLVDRVHNVDPTEFEKHFLDRVVEEAPVLVTQQVTFDSATRVATVYSKLNFVEELNGNYRIAVVFTEDDVTGTTSTYAQKNSYAGGTYGPMGGYENLPATVPAAQMVYDHVARVIIGGFNGAPGSVPTGNPAGSEHFYSVTYTVPNAYDVSEMHAITILLDNATGEAINATTSRVPNVLVSAPEPEQQFSVKLFPNPVVDEANIKLRLKETSDIQVRIIDAYGKVAVERNYAEVSGEQQLPFRAGNLAAGMYMLAVSAKGQTVTTPFVIVR